MAEGDSVSFAVPAHAYSEMQIYGLSTNGDAIVDFTLAYVDGTSDFREITFQDWGRDPAATGQFYVIDGLDRYSPGDYQASQSYAISGANLHPDNHKALVSVKVVHFATGQFVLYGGTAW